MANVNFDVLFNSGATTGRAVNNYTNGDNISLIEITNSDQDYYQNGVITFFDVLAEDLQTVGDSIMITINGVTQFNGVVNRIQQSIDAGKKYVTYQLVGKTYDLWRYHTDANATFNGTTAYIASSLVGTYCPGISGNNIDVTLGTDLSEELDLSNTTIGEALTSLTKLDGYSFYVNNEGQLQYYLIGDDEYLLTVEESDILEMSPVEQADEDLANDILVVGGSDYSFKTEQLIIDKEKKIPSGVVIAQQFLAESDKLSSIDLYLNRSVDPYEPDSLNFEIWENTSFSHFVDDFDNYKYIRDNQGLNVLNDVLKFPYTEFTQGQGAGSASLGQDKFVAQTFRFTQDWSPYEARYEQCYYGAGLWMMEIRPTGAGGFPGSSNTTLTSGTRVETSSGHHGNYIRFNNSIHCLSGVKYCMVFHEVDGLDSFHVYGRYDSDDYAYGTTYHRSNDTTQDWARFGWPEHDIWHDDCRFSVRARTWPGTGSAESFAYIADAQYLKVTLEGVVSSNNITISGTNDSGSTWAKLTDGEWYDFTSESSDGSKIKYYFSGNKYFTPKIDIATFETSDDTGAFDDELFDDKFDNYTYLSSNSNTGMIVTDIIYNGKLSLSGNAWILPDDYDVSAFPGGAGGGIWENPQNLLNDTSDTVLDPNIHNLGHPEAIIFKFDTPQTLDAMYTKSKNKYNPQTSIEDIWVSGAWTGAGTNGWIHTGKTCSFTPATPADGEGFIHKYCNLSDCEFTESGDWVFSGVKQLKINIDYRGQTGYDYEWRVRWWKFRKRRYYTSSNIKSNTYNLASNVNMEFLNIEPLDITYPDLITYSGSLNEGANWTKLVPNENTTIGTAGTKAIIWYNMKPSGKWPALNSSSTFPISTARVGSAKVTASLVVGGGVPNSGTRVTYSDDLSFTDSVIPYPPSWSGWKSYSDPKLKLTENNTYWMVFSYPSSETERWSYYYDPNSIYAKMAYSWDYGITWSSSAEDPNAVHSGNMAFRLGWKEGDISYSLTDEDSIENYGRHFKRISDSTILTAEAARVRAEAEISGAGTIPKKGNMTLVGQDIIGTHYYVSANLANLGITENLSIVSYTHHIDQNGFTTTLNYGVQPFDIARRIASLESSVY